MDCTKYVLLFLKEHTVTCNALLVDHGRSSAQLRTIYTTERGSDEYPSDPSRLVVIGTDSTSMNEITCDEGCTCTTVNDSVLGCGIVAETGLGWVLDVSGTSSSRSSEQQYLGMNLFLVLLLLSFNIMESIR